MSFFKELEDSGAGNMQKKYLGPTYPYYKNVREPGRIGMGTSGTLPQLGRNIDGLIQYVDVLITGKGDASTTGKPLGNKFFMKTGVKCQDIKTKEDVSRYIYIDNVPNGNIPLLSSAMGVDLDEFSGLIPGALSNMEALNPMAIMSAFTTGKKPPCRALTMQTIDTNNRKGVETQFVADSDIKALDPCSWENGVNPLTNERCSEGFTNSTGEKDAPTLPRDLLTQIYFACLGILIIYLVYRIMIRGYT